MGSNISGPSIRTKSGPFCLATWAFILSFPWPIMRASRDKCVINRVDSEGVGEEREDEREGGGRRLKGVKEPHAPPQKKKGKRWREEGNVSWMRLCQSVTASADIALFVGRRERRKGLWMEEGRK